MEKVYDDQKFKIIKGDCFKQLRKIEPKSIDMIFADPPYFLSNDGISCSGGKQVSVNKGEWDKTNMTIEKKIKYSRKWLKLCREALKDNGSIWISGTYHNIYSIGVALEMEGFSIINNITWQKPNPAPNLACRSFTHSTETIIWARKQISQNKKGKHYFNYSLMKELNNDKQMKDVWLINLPLKKEKVFGKHPTQKPESLLERIILASTKENDIILDPFNGSGTTGIVAYKLNRRYIGIEKEEEYIKITEKRLIDIIKE
ncbi:MAG: site-specific DNA-methyltransferase [Bacilli bacterium]|nr:site-specific DNA-methyltransferase [Bacilli bacterium]